MRMSLTGLLCACTVAALLFSGCGRKSDGAGESSGIVNTWKTVETPEGADPSVPDSLGGNGFEAIAEQMGYSTEIMKPEHEVYFGDPNAKTGGEIRLTSSRYPLSFRPFFFGPNANFTENSIMSSMSYQALISLHPVTSEYIPSLATHWKISEDKQTFYFRIDPRARFWDGKRLTARDVVATWKLVMDPTILSPSMQQTFNKYEEPVAISPYIVMVKAKEQNWRSFMSFGASLNILQADQIEKLTGREFVDKFQFEQPIGSGEYIILSSDIKKEQSYKFTRRDDFWAKDDSMGKYSGNFDHIVFTSIVDNNTVEYETFKRGESDIFYYTSISIENWVNDTKDEAIQKNWVKKIRVKTDGAMGSAGIYFNSRKAPFDDINIRKAFFYLFDRKSIVDKLLYDEYEPFNSFYSNGMYENLRNNKYDYNPKKAAELLAEAGWSKKNSNGILTKNGRPFVVDMSIQKPIEKFVTPYQQTLKQAGIDLKLKFEDGNSITKNIAERNYFLSWANYGGLTFPNPESSLSSELADKTDNNNITGFKNARVDELIEIYKTTFTQAERAKIVQEIDGIVSQTVIAALIWNPKGIKIGYWNKFGVPEYVFTRTTQPGDHDLSIISLWWFDAEKAEALSKAKKSGSALPGDGKVHDVLYWKQKKF